MATNSNEIKTQSAIIRLLTPNIVENIILDYVTVEKEIVMELKRVNQQLTAGEPYAVLVDSGILTTISKEARELSASSEFAKDTIAKALLVRNLGHRIVGEFYLRINQPFIKTKIFSERGKAIEWLEKQIRNKK